MSSQNKRLLIISFFTLLLAYSFWYIIVNAPPPPAIPYLISNRPSLYHKWFLLAPFQVMDSAPFYQHISVKYVNWLVEKKFHIASGLFIGAALLTMIHYISQRDEENGVLGAIRDFIRSTPLGLHVGDKNFVPDAGTRMKRALSVAFCAHTLNIVAFTMIISLFPFNIVLLKIISTLLMIYIFVPAVTKNELFKTETLKKLESSYNLSEIKKNQQDIIILTNESWFFSFIMAIKDYLRNLWYVLITAFPLILAAGLLGSLVSSVFYFETVAIQQHGILAMLIALVLATFIPIPLFLDIIIVSILMISGAPMNIVMALLFCLGSYSIIIFTTILQSFSLRVALRLGASVVLLGFLSGLIVFAFL